MTADQIRKFRNSQDQPFEFVMLREIAAQLAEIQELLKKQENRSGIRDLIGL